MGILWCDQENKRKIRGRREGNKSFGMLDDFIIGRIKAELPFEPNEEKEGLLQVLGKYIISREPRKAFILRGYAGTGKTSVMSALVRALSGLKQPCILLAPTGRAAKVLSRYSGFPAYTIHKQIYRQNQLGSESFSLADNLHRGTLFIVDEASGVADPIMEAILGTLSGDNNKLLPYYDKVHRML